MDDPHTLLEQMRSSLAMHKAKKIREDQVRRNKEYFTEVLIEILRPYSEAIVGIDIGELWLHSAHYLLSSEDIRRANIIPPADGTVVGVSMDADSRYQFHDLSYALPYLRIALLSALERGTLSATGIDTCKILAGKRAQIPPDLWAVLDGDFDISAGTVGSNVLICGVKVSRSSRKPSQKAGRKEKVDWDGMEMEFESKISDIGLPDKTNVDGWVSQADVVRWLDDLVERSGTQVSLSTLKRRARILIDKHGSSRGS